MNTSITNSSVDTRYYYASEVARNLRKAFLKAWKDEFTKKKDCEEPLDRQNMYVFLLVPAVLVVAVLFLSKLEIIQRILHGKNVTRKQGYHLFLYFTFILDIIIGSMRCPYRLLKAVTLGALTLARLDHSSLSREFETLDTGFRAYVGFLHFENVTSHPVLLTFVRLLLARPSGFEPKWRKMKLSLKASVAQGEVHIAELGNAFWKDNQMSKKALARHRWHLVYTLMKNPQLQFLRRTTNDWLED